MEQLIEKYYLPLKAFFYKLTQNPAVCEDLTHNVVVKFMRNVDKYRSGFGAKFSTWLFKIAYNEFLNFVQRNPAKKEVLLDESVYQITDSSDVDEAVEKRLLKQAMRTKMKNLPEDMMTLIILRYYNEFSYQEISAITGMHTGKVKWKLHDALEKLRDSMKAAEGGIE